jgi:hypothetical protein
MFEMRDGKPVLVRLMMDCFALPSFQEGSGSAARAVVAMNASTQTSMAASSLCLCVVFTVMRFCPSAAGPHPVGDRVRARWSYSRVRGLIVLLRSVGFP